MLKVLFHDRCFDGTSSAALFGRFYRDVIAKDARIVWEGLRHRDGDPFEGIAFDADDHVCVDFRFTPEPKLTWWFDHHRTAFQPPSLRGVFEARRSPTQWFDPDAPSCCGLIARVLGERYGWTAPEALAETVRWADIIDAAAFPSAADAISLATPAQRLAVFQGAVPDEALVKRYIEELLDGASLAELDAAPWIRDVVDRVLAERARVTARLTSVGRVLEGSDDAIVVLDLLDEEGIPSVGFLAYALFPTCRYAIAATRAHRSIKIAVGYNPWCGRPNVHDIGALCQPLGGGGHAVVGGVTLEPSETDRARATIAAIAQALTG